MNKEEKVPSDTKKEGNDTFAVKLFGGKLFLVQAKH